MRPEPDILEMADMFGCQSPLTPSESIRRPDAIGPIPQYLSVEAQDILFAHWAWTLGEVMAPPKLHRVLFQIYLLAYFPYVFTHAHAGHRLRDEVLRIEEIIEKPDFGLAEPLTPSLPPGDDSSSTEAD